MRCGYRRCMHLDRREALRRFSTEEGVGVEAVDGTMCAKLVKGKTRPVPKITTSERGIDLEENAISFNYQRSTFKNPQLREPTDILHHRIESTERETKSVPEIEILQSK